MGDEPENHTLHLLREMREEQNRNFHALSRGMEDLRTRIDGNTVIPNFIAGVISQHEDRIEALERKDQT